MCSELARANSSWIGVRLHSAEEALYGWVVAALVPQLTLEVVLEDSLPELMGGMMYEVQPRAALRPGRR